MRTRLVLAVALTVPPLAGGVASAGLRETCWEVGPTFYVAGIVCRVVPDAH